MPKKDAKKQLEAMGDTHNVLSLKKLRKRLNTPHALSALNYTHANIETEVMSPTAEACGGLSKRAKAMRRKERLGKLKQNIKAVEKFSRDAVSPILEGGKKKRIETWINDGGITHANSRVLSNPSSIDGPKFPNFRKSFDRVIRRTTFAFASANDRFHILVGPIARALRKRSVSLPSRPGR